MADLFRGDGERFFGTPEKIDWTESHFRMNIWSYERIDKNRFIFTKNYDKDVFFEHNFQDERVFLDWYKDNGPFVDEDNHPISGSVKLRGTLHTKNRTYRDELESFEKVEIADFAESLYFEITKRQTVANALRKRLENILAIEDNEEKENALEKLDILIKKLKNIHLCSSDR